LIKFEKQKDEISVGTSHYWWKRIGPPLEFGSMHAILFQMALIPLTMARYSISVLAGSALDRFLPLNRTLCVHIHLGYTMVILVVFATVFLLTYFGVVCTSGEEEYCEKLTSKIVYTGYGVLASFLIIAATAHFRHRMPYEVFYGIHHLVFILYAIAVTLTFDTEQRQTFQWFSATM
jgi:Ferric reductase like transmembrane component